MGYGFTPTAAAENKPELADNFYDADFESADLWRDSKTGEPRVGQFGMSVEWRFTIYDEGEPVTVTGLTSTSTSLKSKGYAWLCAIAGRQPEVGEQLDLAALKGARCRVLVESRGENNWPTVTDVKPSLAKKGK